MSVKSKDSNALPNVTGCIQLPDMSDFAKDLRRIVKCMLITIKIPQVKACRAEKGTGMWFIPK